jgi:hypothetical protein
MSVSQTRASPVAGGATRSTTRFVILVLAVCTYRPRLEHDPDTISIPQAGKPWNYRGIILGETWQESWLISVASEQLGMTTGHQEIGQSLIRNDGVGSSNLSCGTNYINILRKNKSTEPLHVYR